MVLYCRGAHRCDLLVESPSLELFLGRVVCSPRAVVSVWHRWSVDLFVPFDVVMVSRYLPGSIRGIGSLLVWCEVALFSCWAARVSVILLCIGFS